MESYSCETKYNGSETKQWNLLWNKLGIWNRTQLLYSTLVDDCNKIMLWNEGFLSGKSLNGNRNKWPVVGLNISSILFQFCCCSKVLRLWKRTCQWIYRLREFFMHKTKEQWKHKTRLSKCKCNQGFRLFETYGFHDNKFSYLAIVEHSSP